MKSRNKVIRKAPISRETNMSREAFTLVNGSENLPSDSIVHSKCLVCLKPLHFPLPYNVARCEDTGQYVQWNLFWTTTSLCKTVSG